MYNQNPYAPNPLYDSPAKQVSFLFKKLAELIESAENHRDQKDFQNFAQVYQRAFVLATGLLSWLNAEQNSAMASKTITKETQWDVYFAPIFKGLQSLNMAKNPMVFEALQMNLRRMANAWSEEDTNYAFIKLNSDGQADSTIAHHFA